MLAICLPIKIDGRSIQYEFTNIPIELGLCKQYDIVVLTVMQNSKLKLVNAELRVLHPRSLSPSISIFSNVVFDVFSWLLSSDYLLFG